MSETVEYGEKEYLNDVKEMNNKIREISLMMRRSTLQPIDVYIVYGSN